MYNTSAKYRNSKQSSIGFTIVELLIVIVVIGILAAITLVAYNGMQQRAGAATLKSNLRDAHTRLALDHVSNGSYPASADDANDGKGLAADEGIVFEYTRTDDSYCLTGSSLQAKTAYHISSALGVLEEGPCDGHTGYQAGGGTSLVWTKASEAGQGNPWMVLISPNGSKFFGIGLNDVGPYTSTDGISWSMNYSISSGRIWTDRIASDNGVRLAFVCRIKPECLYTSADSGITWKIQTLPVVNFNSRQSFGLAASQDGSKLVMAASGYLNDASDMTYSSLYRSTDYGESWHELTSAGTRDWRDIASSTDGTKLVAIADGIYTSSDSGGTWQARTSADSGKWNSVASSADGSRLAAVANHGAAGASAYTSTDYGATWTEYQVISQGSLSGLSSSADGMKQAVIGTYMGVSKVFTSTDSGVSWTEQTSLSGDGQWYSMAMSADGNKIVVGGTYIYTGLYK